MPDDLSKWYGDPLAGSYDCIDRIVINGYIRMAHTPGNFRHWWLLLHGTDDNLDNASVAHGWRNKYRHCLTAREGKSLDAAAERMIVVCHGP